MYLKIPEYLPSHLGRRGPAGDNDSYPNKDDGAITFVGNSGKSVVWGSQSMTLLPQVGDFYIFPSSQPHFVYPFRTKDGMGERRSVSFNAVFSEDDTKWNRYD